MNDDEMKNIKNGDILVVQFNTQQIYTKATGDAYYNSDCYEPGWEVETNLATFAEDSVIRKVDIAKDILENTVMCDGNLLETGGVSNPDETFGDFFATSVLTLNSSIGELLEALTSCDVRFGSWEPAEEPELFDCVLIQKPLYEGLSADEIVSLTNKLNDKEILPIEVQSEGSAAIGFITATASDQLDHDYTGICGYIHNILDDMEKEDESCCYEFNSLSIYMGYNV